MRRKKKEKIIKIEKNQTKRTRCANGSQKDYHALDGKNRDSVNICTTESLDNYFTN